MNQAPKPLRPLPSEPSHRASSQITIRTIPASAGRYAAAGCDWAGDWYEGSDGNLIIEVSDAVPVNERWLVAFHEMIEAELCLRQGVTEQMVDEFDFAFKGDGEPGDDPKAPYRKQHRVATLLEELMAREFGIEDYGA